MVEQFIQWVTFAPNLVAAVVIGMAGEVAKKLVLGSGPMPATGYRGLKGVYYVTYKVHALVVGAAIGYIGHAFGGMPLPEAFSTDGPSGAILNYAGTGAAAMLGYAGLVGTLKNHFKNRAQIRESMRPPAADA